jgi:hypothetical protein
MGSGMPFPFSFRTAGGFGGGGFAEDYDSEENEDWSDDGWDSDNEAHAARELSYIHSPSLDIPPCHVITEHSQLT